MIKSIEKLISNDKVRIVIIAFMAVLAAVSVVQGVRNAAAVSQDFQWDASRALLDRVDPYQSSLNDNTAHYSEGLKEFYKIFSDAGIKQKMEANQFPSLLLLLAPYAMMPPLFARYAWIVSNLFFTVGIIWLLRKTFLKKLAHFDFLFVVLFMLAGTPYRNQIGVGQHTLFSFFFFLLAVWLDEKKRDGNRIPVAVCMFISYFKYTLTAPLTLYLLYRKRYREFAASVAAHILLTVGAAVYMGTSVIYMIKAPLQVSSLLSAEGGIDLGALFGGGSIALVIGGLIALFLLAVTIMLPKGKDYLLFATLLLWSLIITYHRTYDFFVLTSIAALFTKDAVWDDYGKKITNIGKIWYWILMILVFFGLRLFNENTISKVVVGVIYYVFTLFITYLTAVTVIKNRNGQN